MHIKHINILYSCFSVLLVRIVPVIKGRSIVILLMSLVCLTHRVILLMSLVCLTHRVIFADSSMFTDF